MMFVAVPTEISDQIDVLIDGALASIPEAAHERDHLRSQLVSYFCDHGQLPPGEAISIARREEK